jgi:hypothetical protein
MARPMLSSWQAIAPAVDLAPAKIAWMRERLLVGTIPRAGTPRSRKDCEGRVDAYRLRLRPALSIQGLSEVDAGVWPDGYRIGRPWS